MGLIKAPNINIAFKEKAETVFTRGERGIVGLCLQDTVLQGTNFEVLESADIYSPSWSFSNQFSLNSNQSLSSVYFRQSLSISIMLDILLPS